MTLSPLAKHVLETEMGWTANAKGKRSTPRVTVEMGDGVQIGGSTPIGIAIERMREVWADLEEVIAEIARLDNLVHRQQTWLDQHETDAAWLGYFGERQQHIERLNVLCRDVMPGLESRAKRIVERVNGPDLEQLSVVHPYAPQGGHGVTTRYFEVAPLIHAHEEIYPTTEVPF